MQFYAGIDPGQEGALAIVSVDMQEAQVWDYPGEPETAANLLRDVSAQHHPALVCLEKVGAMPRQGVSSTFKFGQNYGCWHGALSALQLLHILVTRTKWQRAILDSGGGDTKTRSLSMARRLFPSMELNRKKHHGRADALLLAVYATQWHSQQYQ